MAKTLQLKAQERTEASSAVRQAGNIPAILYGHGIKNMNLQVDSKLFASVFAQGGQTTLVNLVVGKSDHSVLIREIQLHPVKNYVQHVDFYQVRLDEKVTVEVPLEFVGEAPAVKDKGGILIRNLDSVNVEALPQDLPYEIEVKIDDLQEYDDAIQVKDLPIPNGVEVLDDKENVVAVVQAPRTQEEIEALSEEVTEDIEGVEGIAKEDEAEAEEGSAAEGEADEDKEKPTAEAATGDE